MKQFNTQEVVAVACAIFRATGNKVIKDNDEKIVTSKQLLADHFAGKQLVEITDADREHGDLCVAQLRHRVLMNQLTSRNQNDFIDTVCEMVQHDNVGASKFGRAVWIPKVVAGMHAEEQQKMDIAHLSFTSQYQGKLGSKIAVEFNPIRVKYVHEYGCFRHFGHDGCGNLIGFLHKKELSGKITGKVKGHEVSKFNNHGRVTYLNYVKEA